MRHILGPLGVLGHDSPDLIQCVSSPAALRRKAVEAIRAYHSVLLKYNRAQARYDDLAATISDEEPASSVAARLDRLEAAYERLIRPLADAEEAAMTAMTAVGAGVNRGGFCVDGRLFVVVRDIEATQPTIHVVELADVHDLD